MFGRRCSLCGGKLNSNNICTECGLDNSKSDKNYRLNESDCDHRPLTHVHEQNESASRKNRRKTSVGTGRTHQQTGAGYGGTYQQAGTGYGGTYQQTGAGTGRTTQRTKQGRTRRERGNRRSFISVIIFLITILMAIGPIFGTIRDQFDNTFDFGSDTYDDSDYTYDPYANLDEELPETGMEAEYTLPSGNYLVGVHIPAGNYSAEVSYAYDSVQVKDSEHGIYLYEYLGQSDENHLDDLRLFPGAMVVISSETTVTLTTENAQSDELGGEENPLGDYSVKVGQTATVGATTKDSPVAAGVYDVTVLEGSGFVEVEITDNGNAFYSIGLSMGEGWSDGEEYRNLVLPEGATITCDEGLILQLKASDKIESEDYLEYYYRY